MAPTEPAIILQSKQVAKCGTHLLAQVPQSQASNRNCSRTQLSSSRGNEQTDSFEEPRDAEEIRPLDLEQMNRDELPSFGRPHPLASMKRRGSGDIKPSGRL